MSTQAPDFKPPAVVPEVVKSSEDEVMTAEEVKLQ
jgi:hypothetical protein